MIAAKVLTSIICLTLIFLLKFNGGKIMKLDFLSNLLTNEDVSVNFLLPSGKYVSPHFHVTEVAKVQKSFTDCGGVKRSKEYVTLQLWHGDDFDHRLTTNTLSKIIGYLGDKSAMDLEVLVELEENTIGLYEIEEAIVYGAFENSMNSQAMVFQLKRTSTNCLAPDKCGLKPQKCGTNCC
jgi:hypothetical protein